MNFHCNKLIHSVSNSAKPIFLTISTKSYFYHSEVFPFPCCIRWSLFPYILRGSFSKSNIHPVIPYRHLWQFTILPGHTLMGMPFPHTHRFSAKIKLATIPNSRSTYEIGWDSRCITWINSVYATNNKERRDIIAPKKKEKSQKRNNIVSVKLTQAEMDYLTQLAYAYLH